MARQVAEFDSKELNNWLRKIIGKTDDIKKRRKSYVRFIGSLVFEDIIDHFSKEEGPSGPWDSWSLSYRAVLAGRGHFRRKGGRTIFIKGPDPERTRKPPQNILQDTGNLRQHIDPIERGSRWRRVTNGILWFNAAKTKDGFPYAAHHNHGKSSWSGQPRPFMWLSDRGLEKIGVQTLKFIEAKL